MAPLDVLKTIVAHGSDLTIYRSVPADGLRELAAIAKTSGARLTIGTNKPAALIDELSRNYGKTISFIEGIDEVTKK